MAVRMSLQGFAFRAAQLDRMHAHCIWMAAKTHQKSKTHNGRSDHVLHDLGESAHVLTAVLAYLRIRRDRMDKEFYVYPAH